VTGTESAWPDPRAHTQNIKRELQDLVGHVRRDVERVDDPRAQALFEMTAEVLVRLEKAFTDFEQRIEPAWRG
jgi:hypothetical protein